jgi:hypothetical protein
MCSLWIDYATVSPFGSCARGLRPCHTYTGTYTYLNIDTLIDIPLLGDVVIGHFDLRSVRQ